MLTRCKAWSCICGLDVTFSNESTFTRQWKRKANWEGKKELLTGEAWQYVWMCVHVCTHRTRPQPKSFILHKIPEKFPRPCHHCLPQRGEAVLLGRIFSTALYSMLCVLEGCRKPQFPCGWRWMPLPREQHRMLPRWVKSQQETRASQVLFYQLPLWPLVSNLTCCPQDPQ